MFVNMVIEGLVVRRPKQAHRAEVGIYSTTRQLHLRPAQGVARVETHKPIILGHPKRQIAIGHVDTILTLA